MVATSVARSPLTPAQIKSLLSGTIEEQRLLVRPIDLIAYASDASFYRLILRAVV